MTDETAIEPADPTRWQREWSPRKARICPKCGDRHFGDLTWLCPQHGIAEDQEDRPHFGEYPKARRASMSTSALSSLPEKPPDGVTYGKRKPS